jgi:hypothetical protein
MPWRLTIRGLSRQLRGSFSATAGILIKFSWSGLGKSIKGNMGSSRVTQHVLVPVQKFCQRKIKSDRQELTIRIVRWMAIMSALSCARSQATAVNANGRARLATTKTRDLVSPACRTTSRAKTQPQLTRQCTRTPSSNASGHLHRPRPQLSGLTCSKGSS